MKKLCLKSMLVIALMLTTPSLSAFAEDAPIPAFPRISNELATVKACDQALRLPYLYYFDLTKVQNAAVRDTGRGLQVMLDVHAFIAQYGALVPAGCTTYSWLNYDGSRAVCDECLNAPFGCNCVVAQCQTDLQTQVFKTDPLKN